MRPTAGRGLILVGATVLVALAMLIAPAAGLAGFGFQPGQQTVSLSTLQAGAHPDMTTAFKLNVDSSEFPEGGTMKDIAIAMPPGLSGSATAAPTCTETQLILAECPPAAQVGEFASRFLEFGVPHSVIEPLYNLAPPGDAAAEFGVNLAVFNVEVKIVVRPSDYGLTAESRDNPDLFPVVSGAATLWGIPSDHNGSGGARRSLLTNASVCGAAGAVRFSADSWQAQDQFATDQVALPPFTGCSKLPGLTPALTASPGSHEAGQPSGFDVDLEVPQVDNPDGIDTPPVQKVVMALPKGVHISPPAAAGLQACSDGQVDFASAGPVSCPDASKVGTVTVDTPALERPLSGAMYVGEPKPGDTYRLIFVAEGPGVTIKLPGSVQADPATGQLTTTFEDTPQLPFSALHVHLKSGPQALLANPASCGTYTTTATLTPYGGGPTAAASSSFRIAEGCGPAGFEPDLHAGAVDPTAGAFSPFVFETDRRDGEQNVASLDVTMPPGELARLAGVPLCPNVLAASGDCPSGSKVGTTTVAAGSGATPLWVPQPGKERTAVFLAGPYAGAPYSIVVKVPAQAGPYDLGTVAVRSGIYVDPETTRVTVKSDRLPQIIEGIPIAYRTIHVDIDRSAFALNPTNCEPFAVKARIHSDAGALATPSDRFRVGNCRALGFRPKLSLRVSGATHRGAHPALRAALTMPKGDADIARASVALPRSEFLEQGHIRTVCTRVQFAAEKCPGGAVYGFAVAKTPLLDKPLRGPVYLRSSSHELPDLVADLRGAIHVVLDGRIDSVKGGGLRTVFTSVPDAPVSRFLITMKGGSKSLLVNSTNLCDGQHRADVAFTGQNGRVMATHPSLKAACGKRGR